MIYRSFTIVSLLTLSAPLSALAGARTLDEIKKSKELRACFSEGPGSVELEPASCRGETCKKISGAAAEMIALFAKEINVKVKSIAIEWDEQFFNEAGTTKKEESYTPNLLNTGKCDIYPSHLTELPWRSKMLNFSILFPNRMMVVVHKENKKTINTVSALSGRKAIIEKDSSHQTWVESQNKSEFASKPVAMELATSVPTVFEKVGKKEVEFTIADTDIAMYNIKQNKALAAAFPIGDMDKLGWATAKTSTGLKEAIDAFFDKQMKSKESETQKIWKKYYGVTLNDFANVVSQVK